MNLKLYVDERIKKKDGWMELAKSTRIKEIMNAEGCSFDEANERISDLTDEEIVYGYGMFIGVGEVSNAYTIGKIEGLYATASDKNAANFYERHGGSIIRDINTDKYYIDDPENREKVERYYYDKADSFLSDFFSKEEYVVRKIEPIGMLTRRRMEFNDGFSLSVQAGRGYGSCPNEKLDDGSYISFEAGFMNNEEPLMESEAGYSLYGTDEVYENVNRETIIKVIMKHGVPKKEEI